MNLAILLRSGNRNVCRCVSDVVVFVAVQKDFSRNCWESTGEQLDEKHQFYQQQQRLHCNYVELRIIVHGESPLGVPGFEKFNEIPISECWENKATESKPGFKYLREDALW